MAIWIYNAKILTEHGCKIKAQLVRANDHIFE